PEDLRRWSRARFSKPPSWRLRTRRRPDRRRGRTTATYGTYGPSLPRPAGPETSLRVPHPRQAGRGYLFSPHAGPWHGPERREAATDRERDRERPDRNAARAPDRSRELGLPGHAG